MTPIHPTEEEKKDGDWEALEEEVLLMKCMQYVFLCLRIVCIMNMSLREAIPTDAILYPQHARGSPRRHPAWPPSTTFSGP